MSYTLFIDNLPDHLTQSELDRFVAPFQPVRTLLATHRSGRCLGFGFVVFATEQEAEEATRSLNGRLLNGSAVRLSKRITAGREAEVG